MKQRYGKRARGVDWRDIVKAMAPEGVRDVGVRAVRNQKAGQCPPTPAEVLLAPVHGCGVSKATDGCSQSEPTQLAAVDLPSVQRAVQVVHQDQKVLFAGVLPRALPRG